MAEKVCRNQHLSVPYDPAMPLSNLYHIILKSTFIWTLYCWGIYAVIFWKVGLGGIVSCAVVIITIAYYSFFRPKKQFVYGLLFRWDTTWRTQIYEEANNKKSAEQKEEIKIFLSELDDFSFSDESALADSDKYLLYYIAG